jgi:ketosteroid isomerase-like protein
MQRRNLAALPIAGLVTLPIASALAQPAAIEAVRAANLAFDAATSRRDIEALAALCVQDDRVIAVHPRDRTALVGWAAVRRSWEEVFARFSELTVDMPQSTIRVTGDVAVVAGLENITGRVAANGNPVRFDAMTTNVFELRGGRWLMAHHHATMMPA